MRRFEKTFRIHKPALDRRLTIKRGPLRKGLFLRIIGIWLWTAQAIAFSQTTVQLMDSDYHRLSTPTEIVFPVKCDDRGNVYFRSAARGPGKFDVVKIAPDGSQKATYTYSGVADIKDDTLLAASAGDHGEMYELLRAPGQRVLLLRFSENGQLESRTEIDAPEPFAPAQLDVLPNGTLFVSGTLIGDKTGQGAGEPVNALYDASGRWLKEIRLKNDSGLLKQSLKTADRIGSQNRAVHFGRTTVGDDGNLYLMRAASPAVVYVISPGGEVERTLTVQPPGDGAVPFALLVHGGRVVVEFDFPTSPDVSDTRIRLVDSHSGQPITDYKVTTDLGEAVACYDGSQFTFVGMKDGWRSIIQAPTH